MPTGFLHAACRAPDETETPGGRPASLCPKEQGADGSDDDGDGEGGGGTRPHHVVGSSHVEGAQVAVDDWSDAKGKDAAHGHQTTTLRTENVSS